MPCDIDCGALQSDEVVYIKVIYVPERKVVYNFCTCTLDCRRRVVCKSQQCRQRGINGRARGAAPQRSHRPDHASRRQRPLKVAGTCEGCGCDLEQQQSALYLASFRHCLALKMRAGQHCVVLIWSGASPAADLLQQTVFELQWCCRQEG